MLAKSIILAAVILSALSLHVSAEKFTLACKFKTHIGIGIGTLADVDGATDAYQRVDQIMIDTDTPSFELRVANTMGTSHEEFYLYGSPYTTDNKSCLKPQIQTMSGARITMSDDPEEISGSQECGAPTGFFYDKALHQFVLSELFIGGGSFFEWDCE